MILGHAIVLIVGLSANSHSATMAANNMHVSTIGVPGTSPGINIATHAYFAAGSSLTLSGSQGYITAQSSINASAFFGDGSRLMNVASLSGDNSFTGAALFSSSFTIQSNGRRIVFSTGSAIDNLLVSTDGVVSFSPQLHNTSATAVQGYSTTNASFGPCIPSSTITFTTSGGRVELIFTGNIELASQITQTGTWINFLQDGQFVRDLSADKGFMVWTDLASPGGSVQSQPIRIAYLLDAPTAGAHSYCLTMLSLNGYTSTLTSSNASNLFYVKEIK